MSLQYILILIYWLSCAIYAATYVVVYLCLCCDPQYDGDYDDNDDIELGLPRRNQRRNPPAEQELQQRRQERHRVTINLPLRTPVAYSSSSSKSNEEECPICLEEFKDGAGCRVLTTCNHTFHSDCVDEWLIEKLTCPVCRDLIDIRTVIDFQILS